jgi:hypothetical protein
MPEKQTLRRARRDKAQGKSASTQAGEFVRQEMEHIRQGKHGARSAKQAIAIGLSEARRAGVKLPAPKRGTVSKQTRRKAEQDYEKGQQPRSKRQTSPKRSRARLKALKKEPRSAASHMALSRQAKSAAKKRTHRQRSASAKKAARTRSR